MQKWQYSFIYSQVGGKAIETKSRTKKQEVIVKKVYIMIHTILGASMQGLADSGLLSLVKKVGVNGWEIAS
jgi:hypothetical protein